MDNESLQNEQVINSAFDTFSNIELPRWENLPEIDLYMDQVIVLMEKYLINTNYQLTGASDEEKIITPAMVNNYVKKGYMPAPVRKKYGKEHIAHLFIICIMKQSLPISVIDFFIKKSLEVIEIDELFNLFIESYEACFSDCIIDMKQTYSDILESVDNDFMPRAIMAIRATALSNSGKIVGQIVNSSFVVADESDSTKQGKRK